MSSFDLVEAQALLAWLLAADTSSRHRIRMAFMSPGRMMSHSPTFSWKKR